MKIYFVRHGESEANILQEISNRGLKHGLTPKGRAQATALAQKLETTDIRIIYSSPILRAIETAIILANQLHIPYEIVDALKEYDCGVIEGHSRSDAWAILREYYLAWLEQKRLNEGIAEGETFLDIQHRFLPFMQQLIQQYKATNDNILCVSHGGVYTFMLPLVIKNIDQGAIQKYGFDYTTCIISEYINEQLYCTEWNGQKI